MSSKEFDIEDLNKLISELDKKGADIKKAIKKGVSKTTQNCRSRAIKLAPVKTGALRENIHADITEQGESVIGEVTPTMEYSVYVETGTGPKGKGTYSGELPVRYRATSWTYTPDNGKTFYRTKGQEAQPYMYPAYVEQREKLVPNIKKELTKTLRGAT